MKKIFLSLTMMVALISCGGGSDTSNASEKVLTYNAVGEGPTLDAAVATDGTTLMIHNLISDGLTHITVDNAVEPALAKDWVISEDGLTWTFNLRDDIKWSNGEPITAQDFEYSWKRALDPTTASEYAYMLYVIKGAEAYNSGTGSKDDVAIKALDDKTLEVHLEAVTPYFDSLVSFLTYLPTNQAFVESQGDQYALEPENLIFSGPYKLVSWEHNSNMKLEKNPDYFNKDSIDIDNIEVKFIADTSAGLNAFKNGELDLQRIEPEQLEEFKDDSRLHKVLMSRVDYFSFNLQSPILSNLNIRKAIAYAIDKEDITENLLLGVDKAAYSFTPKNVGMLGMEKDLVDELDVVFPKVNKEEAQKYLAAGLAELGLDKLPTLSLIADERGSNKKYAVAIQEQLRSNLGLDVEVEIMTFKERLGRMQARDFELLYTSWGADYQDPMTFLDLLMSTSGNNHPSYHSEEYDRNIQIAKTTGDKAKRVEAFKNAERLLVEDMPIIPIAQKQALYLVSDNIKDVSFQAFGSDYNFRPAKFVK